MYQEKVDLHLHSTASDGTDTIQELYEHVKSKGIRVFALTDHDTIAGNDEMASLCAGDSELLFLPGIEFSCHSGIRKTHIVGLAIDSHHPAITALIEEGRANRKAKYHHRVKWLQKQHGIELPKAALTRLSAINNVGKPHLAEELIQMGLGTEITEVINRYLKHCDEGCDPQLSAGKAIRAILAAGGIPVWAHPMGGENARHLSEEEIEENLKALLPHGLRAMECHYSRYTRAEEQLLLMIAARHGLRVSAGSDYHGLTKTVALGCLCAEPQEVYLEEETGVLWEILSGQRFSI